MSQPHITARYTSYALHFKKAGGTSRGVLHQKETYILSLQREAKTGYGECALFRGLSADDVPAYEEKLKWLCEAINSPKEELLRQLQAFPSLQFGLEQALLSLEAKNPFELFPSEFSRGAAGIPINGLIWMGSIEQMKAQIAEKLQQGYATLKLKIGALNFEEEFALLSALRKTYSAEDLELRVDANGAFTAQDALKKLNRLSTLDIHSIEQPVRAGQLELMANLCAVSPLDIALDEELIGIVKAEEKKALLERINPPYIILKPSLVGGFGGTDEWIALAETMGIDWWITSALESNIGLNAIAQYTYLKQVERVQGLGTGGLFTNNFKAPLYINQGNLRCNPEQRWAPIEI